MRKFSSRNDRVVRFLLCALDDKLFKKREVFSQLDMYLLTLIIRESSTYAI